MTTFGRWLHDPVQWEASLGKAQERAADAEAELQKAHQKQDEMVERLARSQAEYQSFDWSQWTARGPAADARPGGTYTRTVSPEEFEQIFGGQQGTGFSDLSQTLFGGAGRAGGRGLSYYPEYTYQPRPRRGRDSECQIQITLPEAFYWGTRVEFDVGRTIEVRTPRGARTGSRVRLSGQGAAGTVRQLAVAFGLAGLRIPRRGES